MRLSGAAAAALLAVAACGADPAPTGARPPVELAVGMSEYRFDAPAATSGRALTFRTKNNGTEEHDLTLIEVPKEVKGSLDEQLRSERRMPVVPVARVKAKGPGERGFFAVDLAPGRYGLICFVKAPDGRFHAQMGMSKELTVR